MSYRPTEFQVNNSGAIECDICIDPETYAGGTMFFQIVQDREKITVSLECLENLLSCANELLQAWRETRAKSPAQEPGAQQGQSSAREGAERSEA